MKIAFKISLAIVVVALVLFVAAQIYVVVKFAFFSDSTHQPLSEITVVEKFKNRETALAREIGRAFTEREPSRQGPNKAARSDDALTSTAEELQQEVQVILAAGTTRLHRFADPMLERRNTIDLAFRLQKYPQANNDELIRLTLMALQEEARDPASSGKYDIPLLMSAHTLYLSLVQDPSQALNGTFAVLQSGVDEATKKDALNQFLFRFPHYRQELRKRLNFSALQAYLADEIQ